MNNFLNCMGNMTHKKIFEKNFVKPHKINNCLKCDFCSRSALKYKLMTISYDCSMNDGWISCSECNEYAISCHDVMNNYDKLFSGEFFGFLQNKPIKIRGPNDKIIEGFILSSRLHNIEMRSNGLYAYVEFLIDKHTVTKVVMLNELLALNNMSSKPLEASMIYQINILMRILATESNFGEDCITDIKRHFIEYIQ